MAKKLRRCIRYISDMTIEKVFALNTKASRSIKEHYCDFHHDNYGYATLSYLSLYFMLKPLKLSSEDVIFDIGSGEGRILCFISLKPVKHCVGIEFVSELVEQAKKNAQSMRFRKSSIDFYCLDAIDADYSTGSVYLLFNPFGENTLKSVLEKIKLSVKQNPRAVRIAYFNPVHESIMDKCGWLSCFYKKKPGLSPLWASYWTNE